VNLGLILRKPGESDLALASRLWIANRYSWHLDNAHISDRIEEEIQSQPFLAAIDCELTGLERIRFIEASHLSNIPRTILPSYLKVNKKRRNCPSCAQSGYHSRYYDFPWLNECPIHHQALVDHCPRCLAPWPRSQDVHLRSCKLCGIREKSTLSKPNLSRNNKMFDNSLYEPIRELDIFFSETVNFARPNWQHHFHLFAGRSSEYARTMLYPSVLAAHHYEDFEEWRNLLPIYQALHSCSKVSFKRDTKRRKSWSSYIGDSTRTQLSSIRKDVLLRAEKCLTELADHSLDSCKGSDEVGMHEYCYYRELLTHLKSAFYHHADSRGNFANYSIKGLGKYRYGDPGLLSYLEDRSDSSDPKDQRFLAIPRSTQFLVYELDIISCVKQLAFQVLLSRGREDKKFKEMESYGPQEVLEHSYGYSNHYFFEASGHDITLYYPEEYHHFSFDDLNRWLSMTRTY